MGAFGFESPEPKPTNFTHIEIEPYGRVNLSIAPASGYMVIHLNSAIVGLMSMKLFMQTNSRETAYVFTDKDSKRLRNHYPEIYAKEGQISDIICQIMNKRTIINEYGDIREWD